MFNHYFNRQKRGLWKQPKRNEEEPFNHILAISWDSKFPADRRLCPTLANKEGSWAASTLTPWIQRPTVRDANRETSRALVEGKAAEARP